MILRAPTNPPTGQEHSISAPSNPEVLVPHGTQEEPSEKAASADSPQEVHLNPASEDGGQSETRNNVVPGCS